MPTYKQIQTWVRSRYGWTPETCWIAHCKELSRIPVGRAWNRQDGGRAKPCPPDRQEAIFEAFRHFGIIPTAQNSDSQGIPFLGWM